MIPGDPLLDLERKNVRLTLTDGEEIRGRLVSVRGDLLTVSVEFPRRRRVSINKYSMRSIEEDKPKVSNNRRLTKAFWR
jgi:hypothetical protein